MSDIIRKSNSIIVEPHLTLKTSQKQTQFPNVVHNWVYIFSGS